MPSTTRRRLLAGLGATSLVGLAGCPSVSASGPPAGSLRFVNDHHLPHVITCTVTDVGEARGEDPNTVTGEPNIPPAQRTLTASASIPPGEERTYEGVFTHALWYAVAFSMDGNDPPEESGRVTYHPAPENADDGRYLSGKVDSAGNLGWLITTTRDMGPFEG